MIAKFKTGDRIRHKENKNEYLVILTDIQKDFVHYYCDKCYFTSDNENNYELIENNMKNDFSNIKVNVGDILIDKDGNIGKFEGISGMCWHSKPYLGTNGVIYEQGSHMIDGTRKATPEEINRFIDGLKEMKIDNAGTPEEINKFIDDMKEIKIADKFDYEFNDYDYTMPFDSFNSELQQYELYIPKGFSAKIENDKVILTKNKSEFERMKEETLYFLEETYPDYEPDDLIAKCINWVKSLKEPVQKY